MVAYGTVSSRSPSTQHDDRSDADLLAAYVRGDVRAFDTLYHRHKDFAARVARRMARDESEAMDVLQEAFAKLVEHAPRLRLTAKVSTWLYPVIRNAIAERRRKERTLRLAPTDDPMAHTPAPAAAPDTSDLARRLAALPDDQREVVMLRVVEELSVQEVALALDIPEGTVKSRLHHALHFLRAIP